ncbi:dihydropteroate synthase [Leptospira langatensis]|uniref:Dihydropteroate synthase n=1 Tax=Leptospira langatensis TaxID=2484983 RepID=A0A5F1ZTU2_9LEPT|nr:dihydropteroate synthase [Leptospira langatensis]TGK03107.1 dihydropteroate synthase [Leptospira langatensis]TGL41864.1 dihydropteroate synthase [Leptospira langatensis]
METKSEPLLKDGNPPRILPPRPILFGVLNITSDSFSDGGKYLQEDQALAKARSLLEEGADVIDIGAQSSNVKAAPISQELEWERMQGLIQELKKQKVSISIDTFRPYVMRKALESGVDYINNIRGFVDEESLRLVKEFSHLPTKYIAMFSQDHGDKADRSSDLTPQTVLFRVLDFFRERKEAFQALGVSEEKIILDPGMGFFLSPDFKVSFSVLSRIDRILDEFPSLMVSVTKKSFLGNGLGGLSVEEREIPTVIAEMYLWTKGVPMIRTHSPISFLRAMKTWELTNTDY